MLCEPISASLLATHLLSSQILHIAKHIAHARLSRLTRARTLSPGYWRPPRALSLLFAMPFGPCRSALGARSGGRLTALCGATLLFFASSALSAQADAASGNVEAAMPGESRERAPSERPAAGATGRSSVLAAPLDLGPRVDRLGDEVAALRGLVRAQMTMVRGLIDDLSPLLDEMAYDGAAAAGTSEDEACAREIAELSARLQQQQLALEEAQRRAEKAEKLAAALDEAEARAAIEIERLSNALASAKARQTEALQQAVQLERRLADAEARLRPVSTSASSERASPENTSSDRAGQGPRAAVELPRASGAGDGADVGNAGAGNSGADPGGDAATIVVYEVRASDTLSSISERVYGDAGAWRRIYDANRARLSSPEALQPGMALVIP